MNDSWCVFAVDLQFVVQQIDLSGVGALTASSLRVVSSVRPQLSRAAAWRLARPAQVPDT